MKQILSSLLISLLTVGAFFYWFQNEEKIAVVDTVKLFNHYNLKIDLEKSEKTRLEQMAHVIDSVDRLRQMAVAVHNDYQSAMYQSKISEMRSTLEGSYKDGEQRLNDVVWERLNDAMNRFGKSKKRHVIIGANGMGTIMYNDGYYDITEEAITFVNKDYEEGH